jgi:hypothetical protein
MISHIKCVYTSSILLIHPSASSSIAWDSIVGIATRYWLDTPGIEFWWWRDFCTCPDPRPGAHSASCTWVAGLFPSAKLLGCDIDHPPPSSAIPLLPLRAFMVCSRVNFTFSLHLPGSLYAKIRYAFLLLRSLYLLVC